jgi:hypothetical protein
MTKRDGMKIRNIVQKNRSLFWLARAVLRFLTTLQLSSCAAYPTPATPDNSVAEANIAGPPPPYIYMLEFNPHQSTIPSEKVRTKFFPLIARDDKHAAFPHILVFSVIGPSDAASESSTLAKARAEWVAHQLVKAGVPSSQVIVVAMPVNKLFPYTGIGNPYQINGPQDIGPNVQSLRLVVITEYPQTHR